MGLLRGVSRRWSGPTVRPLTSDDRENLEAMIDARPAANLFAREQYLRLGLPSSSSLMGAFSPSPFLGVFDAEEAGSGGRGAPRGTGHELVAAVWAGSNVVPVQLPERSVPAVARYLRATRARRSSIFGPASMVLPLWEALARSLGQPFDVRPEQPMLELDPRARLESADSVLPRHHGIAPVRWAVPADFDRLLPASVAMFTEEVGYSPLREDRNAYPRRVAENIRQARTLVALDDAGAVVFKADLGLAAGDQCQLQGVWMAPEYRGRGLSGPLLAQACRLIRPRFDGISLYVNSYNHRARALYRGLGFRQTDTFATVLL